MVFLIFIPKDSWKIKKTSWEYFFPMYTTTKPQNAWWNCKLKTQRNDLQFEATKGDTGFCLHITKVKPWWVRMITGRVITREKPALYSLGSQAGVVVFKRSQWVGASISPTGFVPQHRSRRSYIWNKLSCTKPQRGNLHPIKWLQHYVDRPVVSMLTVKLNNGRRVQF